MSSIQKQPDPYRRVYVWEFPVRFFHWVNALCILLLFGTGYIIGNPQAIFSANEAYQQYWFGWVRFTHFATAYVFFFNFLFRVYWSFVGNEYARWSAYVPHRRSQLINLWETLRTEVFLLDLRGKISVGHNYLASFTYFILFLVFIFQAVTGFALYAGMSQAYLPRIFTWVIPLMGGDAVVRQWHHLVMWYFVVFTIIHIYLVFYHDYIEGRGTTSSIVGGWKFEKESEIGKYQPENSDTRNREYSDGRRGGRRPRSEFAGRDVAASGR